MKPLGPQDPGRLGRYRMLAVIGRGGMGQVLLGQAGDGRLVAVKQIHAHLTGSSEFRDRFRREAIASQQVTGAYTAGVVDVDTDAENPWLASEYIAGPALQEVVDSFGPLHLSGLKLLATGLAMALIEIHRTGLVHRDLKPSNVLLTNEGPRVIDFGIARALEDDVQLTATGTVVGSPAYMSPEQAECSPLSAASDIFSVGTILAMAATGASPFQGVSTPQILYNVLYRTPDTSGVPGPLRPVVDACLAKDPVARPTPEQLLEAAGAIAAEPMWPVRVRRRIAETQDEAIRWATGAAVAAVEDPPDSRNPLRRNHLRVIAAMALATVLGVGAALAWGSGVTGHAVPMSEPALALTPDEARLLDPCRLLEPDVLGELGTPTAELVENGNSCDIAYTTADGKKVSFGVRLGISVRETREIFSMTGTALGWMPLLGDDTEARICERAVLTQNGVSMAVRVQAHMTAAGNGCPFAERALSAVVRRLSVNPPLREVPDDSVLRLDPCAILDRKTELDALGDPAKREQSSPHGCQVTGRDWGMDFALKEAPRPDSAARAAKSGLGVKSTREIGGRTVFVEELPYRCYLTLMVRPTRGDKAEIVHIDLFPAPDKIQPGACDRAARVMSSVIPKLPKS
ncbi:serine/threonine-protein kinase [Nocardia lijiangensis]|uniref:serine/threonine-protein kinase n=1 Tax=Nocardia lijiangensis TaxID=299618 RepID=UPI00083353D2|nr:serine/threonine-protein kinase [Nocardia lijiangensis]